jgi:hypothetical protein
VEFHKLAEFLNKILGSLIDRTRIDQEASNYNYCVICISQSNIAKFTIFHKGEYKDSPEIELSIVAADNYLKLNFLSKQLKYFKELSQNLSKQKDALLSEKNEANTKFDRISKPTSTQFPIKLLPTTLIWYHFEL